MKSERERPGAATKATLAEAALAAPLLELAELGAERRPSCAAAPVIRSLALEYAHRLTVPAVDGDADRHRAAADGMLH